MRNWALISCAMVAMTATSALSAVSVFEDFRTADGQPDFGLYEGVAASSPQMVITSGNSPGVQLDTDSNTSYNGEGILDMHHLNASATASTVALNPTGGTVARDPTTKKVYFSVDLMPGLVSGGFEFNFEWQRGTGADIAFIQASGTGFQVKASGLGSIVPGSSWTLAPNQWSRVILEATYPGSSIVADSSSLKVTVVDSAGVHFLGQQTGIASGPLANANAVADPALWSFRVDGRTDLPDMHLFADLFTTSNVPIPATIPEPATLVLLGVGALGLVGRRRSALSS